MVYKFEYYVKNDTFKYHKCMTVFWHETNLSSDNASSVSIMNHTQFIVVRNLSIVLAENIFYSL